MLKGERRGTYVCFLEIRQCSCLFLERGLMFFYERNILESAINCCNFVRTGTDRLKHDKSSISKIFNLTALAHARYIPSGRGILLNPLWETQSCKQRSSRLGLSQVVCILQGSVTPPGPHFGAGGGQGRHVRTGWRPSDGVRA